MLLSLIIMVIAFLGSNFNVSAISKEEFAGNIYDDFYIKKLHADYSGKYKKLSKLYRKSDGRFVYCIQPWVDIIDGEQYDIITSNQPTILNVSSETWERLTLIAYFGYGYENHTSERWYGMTQLMIWQEVDPTGHFFFTKTSNGVRDYDYDWMADEINSLIDGYYKEPKFNNKNITISIGESVTLTDTNNVLNEYELSYDKNILTASISNNKLNITSKKSGKTEVVISKNYDNGVLDNTPILYNHANSQKLISRGELDPLNIKINVNVVGGKIQILKVDKETNQCKPLGQAQLVGAKYGVYDAGGTLVDTLTIDNNCSATSKELSLGNYTVKEISAPVGYQLDTNVYTANIENSNTIKITTIETVIKGRIKIIKKDKETNQCKPLGQAQLVGAKYGVYDPNGTLVDTLTIDNNCSAISKELPYSDYTVKEISAPVGYQLDTNVYNANIKNNSTVEITTIETVIKGRIKIIKKDKETNQCTPLGQAQLVGAKYGVYDPNGTLVDTLTIDNNCSAISKELPYSDYTVKEISAPVGYQLDTNVYNANIKNNSTVEITTIETVIKGRIKIIKYDSKTKSCKVSGNSTTLAGAVYEIFDYKRNLVDTLTIGEDCSATSKLLPYGDYTIKEKDHSVGYLLDPNDYNVSITENEKVIPITSMEDIVKNYISILKQYKYVNGETTLLNAEEGITFEIYNTDNTVYSTIKTDKNGYAGLELPFGVWRFHQVNTHAGFEKIYDFYITVSETSEKEQYYNILNNKIDAYLKVIKIDSETKKTIAIKDTTFRILNTDTNQYVSQYVSGKVYDKFKTDENGIMQTYLKLEAGNYKLIEVESPYGYLLNKNGLEFTIGENTSYEYTNYGAIVTVTFANTSIKGIFQVNKSGESFVVKDGNYKYESIPLSNVIFDIYAEEDILSADGNHLYYSKGELVDTITTDENGYAKTKKLPLGKYYAIEVATKENYILNNEEYHFELSCSDDSTKVVYETLDKFNYLKKGSLDFSKIDLSTSNPLPNTKIEIYTEDNKLVFSGVTDENGKVVINNLPVGKKMYIVEKEAPKGYVLNTEKMYFEILEDGDIIKSTMTNEKIKGSLDFSKIDLSTSSPLPNTKIEIYTEDNKLVFSGVTDENGNILIKDIEYGKYYIVEKEAPKGYVLNIEKMYFEILEDGDIIKSTMTNEKIKGSLDFSKIDLSTSSPLPNTKIEIYTEDNKLVFSGVTDENGNILIKDIEYGKYYIVEKEAPKGYVLNTEKIYFEILEDGEVVKSTMTNEKIHSTFILNKVDDKGKVVTGVQFGIYDLEDNLLYDFKTNEDGRYELVLEYGKYYYKEISTREDLVLDTEKHYFEVKKNNEIIEFTETNKIVRSTFVLNKVDDKGKVVTGVQFGIYDLEDNLLYDFKTNEDGRYELVLEYGKYYYKEISTREDLVLDTEKHYFEINKNNEVIEFTETNKTVKSIIRIHKIDDKGNSLSGIEIGIFNLQDEIIGKYISDENGYVELEIEYGKYYYKELQTDSTHLLNDEKIYFEITIDGEFIESVLINVTIEVPNTEANDIPFNYILGGLAILCGSGVILYAKKRK